LVKGLHAIPTSQLAELADDPDVAYVSPNRPLQSHLNNATAAVLTSYAWNLGLSGKGVGVAIIDSGIHGDADLNASGSLGTVLGSGSHVVANFDTMGGGADDQYGHGTHVAGIIASNASGSSCTNCTVQFRGVAPGVSLINFHALDKTGHGTDSSVITAINQAIRLKNKYNIRVMNLSLGRPVFESYIQDPLCQAVEAAWKAGIVVVVAAGNEGRNNSLGTNGYGAITAPGNDPYVITMGAMNTAGTPDRGDDVMASYSSKGPTAIDHVAKPDIVAPGNRIVSILGKSDATLAKAYPSNRPPITYYENFVVKLGSTAPPQPTTLS
jgi:serine protease AprX